MVRQTICSVFASSHNGTHKNAKGARKEVMHTRTVTAGTFCQQLEGRQVCKHRLFSATSGLSSLQCLLVVHSGFILRRHNRLTFQGIK